MAVEVKLKKWGSSLGIILPKEYIDANNLKEKDTIIVNIVKEANLKKEYGSLPRKKNMTTQKFKDELRDEE
jgi:antitoxin component of MazEF toxin-antitoxin module